MYSSVVPSYNSSSDEKKDNEIIDASNPENIDKVNKILFEE